MRVGDAAFTHCYLEATQSSSAQLWVDSVRKTARSCLLWSPNPSHVGVVATRMSIHWAAGVLSDQQVGRDVLVLSVDIGIVHLGLVAGVFAGSELTRTLPLLEAAVDTSDTTDIADVKAKYPDNPTVAITDSKPSTIYRELEASLWPPDHSAICCVRLVDATSPTHARVSKRECGLHHSNELCDRLDHVFQEETIFDRADIILLERQPPCGHTAVSNLIMTRYRTKSLLVSPCTVHKHFGLSKMTYDQRKDWTTAHVLRHLPELKWPGLADLPRKHDIGDALCQLDWWMSLATKQIVQLGHRWRQRFLFQAHVGVPLDDWFFKFAHGRYRRGDAGTNFMLKDRASPVARLEIGKSTATVDCHEAAAGVRSSIFFMSNSYQKSPGACLSAPPLLSSSSE